MGCSTCCMRTPAGTRSRRRSCFATSFCSGGSSASRSTTPCGTTRCSRKTGTVQRDTRSTTGPDSRLFRKGSTGAQLGYQGHVLMEHRSGLVRATCVSLATGFGERESALSLRRNLMSDEHFPVDGTLLQAWASQKRSRPKDGPPGGTARDTERTQATNAGGGQGLRHGRLRRRLPRCRRHAARRVEQSQSSQRDRCTHDAAPGLLVTPHFLFPSAQSSCGIVVWPLSSLRKAKPYDQQTIACSG